jgi:hypothetical protein
MLTLRNKEGSFWWLGSLMLIEGGRRASLKTIVTLDAMDRTDVHET